MGRGGDRNDARASGRFGSAAALSASNEYVYFIVMFIETKKRTGAR